MTGWLLDTLLYTGLLIALVLVLRRPVSRHFGPQIAYTLWGLPFLRLLLPPVVLPASLAPEPAAAPELAVETAPAAGSHRLGRGRRGGDSPCAAGGDSPAGAGAAGGFDTPGVGVVGPRRRPRCGCGWRARSRSSPGAWSCTGGCAPSCSPTRARWARSARSAWSRRPR